MLAFAWMYLSQTYLHFKMAIFNVFFSVKTLLFLTIDNNMETADIDFSIPEAITFPKMYSLPNPLKIPTN